MNVVMMDDHTGKTWAEIVGETSKKRLGAGEMGTREVDAASIAGMTLTAMIVQGDTPIIADGTQIPANYKGIGGTAFCQGSNCMVEVNGDVLKFTGSWYFTPESPMVYYFGTTTRDGTTYAPEIAYAQFGHWLTEVTGDVTVHTFARRGGGAVANTGALVVVEDAMLDESATYEGTAAGMSLHKEVDGDGGVVPGTLQSGAFTADVTLTATFGASPLLGGYINGFEGNAVDPDWKVTLVEGDFGGATLAAGTTTASGQDGEWSATGYGAVGARPTGTFGGFNAHFTDGDAAGAYATRK